MEGLASGKQFITLDINGLTWLIIAGIIAVIAYLLYFSLIQKKNKVKEALSSIDVQLKKRYDLIPNVLIIANKYMEHEKFLIEEITKLRSSASKMKTDFENAPQKLKLDEQIQNKMGQLLVNVENYPQLKADTVMIKAIQTYNEIEEHISAARRFYNAAALELNNAVEIFPGSLLASKLNIKPLPFFELTDEKESKRINAKEYFS